jgi:hypothetical protein
MKLSSFAGHAIALAVLASALIFPSSSQVMPNTGQQITPTAPTAAHFRNVKSGSERFPAICSCFAVRTPIFLLIEK